MSAAPHPEAQIYWLASYPKSGNTWMRTFITQLLSKEEEQAHVDINELNTGAIASSYEWIEEALGIEISELSQDEIDRLRPEAYCWISRHMNQPGYHKIHDAYTYLADDTPLIPAEATRGVLYLVRNPLDVAISFAHHNNSGIEKSIERMSTLNFSFCGHADRIHNQLRQWLLSWSAHVKSWREAPDLDVKLVRYEDMKKQPEKTFTEMAKFLELPCDKDSVTRALEQCAIEKLQQQEAENGFREKMPLAKRFFRKGIVGDWRSELTPEQIDTIINEHREVMMSLGYLNEAGQPSQEVCTLV